VDDAAVCGDDVRRDQVVGGVAVQPLEPAAAGAEREARDPRRRHASARRGETVRSRRRVELTPVHAGLRAHRPRVRVDGDLLHRREVEHDPAVAHRVAIDPVAAALDRQRKVRLARQRDARADVRRAAAADDQPRLAVDHPVEELPCVVVARVALLQDVAVETCTDVRKRSRVECRGAQKLTP
jgi:hypothetical protein